MRLLLRSPLTDRCWQTVAPTQASVQAHTQLAEQIKHAPVPLKHTEVAHDASQPKVEPAVHIKPNPHPAVMAEVAKVCAPECCWACAAVVALH